MVRHRNIQPRFATKEALLLGGPDVMTADYTRASRDKSGRVRSVSGQKKDHGERIEERRWTWAASFEDNDESGAFEENREGFQALRRYIETDRPDVIVLWMINREARDLELFSSIRNLCIRNGVCYWLAGTQLYDLRNKDDRLQLGLQAVLAENFRDGLVEATTRGMRDMAHEGDPPPGIAPFGYRRIYDSRTGVAIGLEPDDEVPAWLIGPDRWTPWEIVKEIFRQARAGVGRLAILRYLNGRGIPNPRTFNALQKGYEPIFKRGDRVGQRWGSKWKQAPLDHILTNPIYLGQRRYHGEIVRDDCDWAAAVDPEDFAVVGEAIGQQQKRIVRTGRAKHHLSTIALCGWRSGAGLYCDEPLTSRTNIYRCGYGHVGIVRATLDQFVIESALLWLMDPDRYEAISAEAGDDPLLIAAQAKLDALADEETKWKALIRQDVVKPDEVRTTLTRIISDRAEALSTVRRLSGLPARVREMIGPDAARKWAALDLAARRDLMRTLVGVRVLPAGKGKRIPINNRVELTWLPDRASA